MEYPEVRILLLTSGSYVKIATPRLELTENIKELDVSEISVEDMKLKYPNLTIVSEVLAKVHTLRWVRSSQFFNLASSKSCISCSFLPFWPL